MSCRIFLFLFLVGCSVHPLYDTDSPVGDDDCSISVDAIAERDGQKLRSYLMDTFRDIKISEKSKNKRLRLKVILSSSEKGYALSTYGNAERVLFTYAANVTLTDENNKVLLSKPISVSTRYNISYSHGEILLSIYGRNNEALIKELSYKIIENVKVALEQ